MRAGQGGGEPKKCAPDIGKAILLTDAVVVIDYYRDSLYAYPDTHGGENGVNVVCIVRGWFGAAGGKEAKGVPDIDQAILTWDI